MSALLFFAGAVGLVLVAARFVFQCSLSYIGLNLYRSVRWSLTNPKWTQPGTGTHINGGKSRGGGGGGGAAAAAAAKRPPLHGVEVGGGVLLADGKHGQDNNDGDDDKSGDAGGGDDGRSFTQRLRRLRKGASVHRKARQRLQASLHPGMRLIDIAELVESAARRGIGYDKKRPLAAGLAFPCGVSVNHCAAHYTPNPGELAPCLGARDLVKVDFGVHVEGELVDCAFSFSFDEVHTPLMRAVQAATEAGIKMAGVDVRVSDIGAEVREVMESFEVTYGGKTAPVRSMCNLNGHLIEPHRIHAGVSVPNVATGDSARMQANQVYAIETFGAGGGIGFVGNLGESSHFMRPWPGSGGGTSRLTRPARNLLKEIDENFGTLAFCPRWLRNPAGYRDPLQELVSMGFVNEYPPLCDIAGCYTAQYEHTVAIPASGTVKVVTRGQDY